MLRNNELHIDTKELGTVIKMISINRMISHKKWHMICGEKFFTNSWKRVLYKIFFCKKSREPLKSVPNAESSYEKILFLV